MCTGPAASSPSNTADDLAARDTGGRGRGNLWSGARLVELGARHSRDVSAEHDHLVHDP
jgi:hypothetical protein